MIKKPVAGLSRRAMLVGAAGAFAAPAISFAQAYPQRQVKFVVAFPAGGAADIVARLVGDRLNQIWGQTVVVENRAGAGGNIAGSEVVRSAPDGYTFLITSQSVSVNRFLYKSMPFDATADLVPVSMMIAVPNVMVVPASSPDKTAADFIARAKANPGKLSFGSAGAGTSIHLAGELFKARTGIDITHVPYRGAAPAMTDLIAGRIDVMFDTLTVSASQLRGGSVRALGITSRERAPSFPDVAPLADTVPGYEVNTWFGLLAPKGTPADVVAKASKDVAEALKDQAVMQRLGDLGARSVGSTPSALGEAMQKEAALWEPIIKAADIKVE
ncbi:MAG: hypothetical protein A4S14_18895 [Proteobacteria bacterium SG_bin9]|nr:MAG: hypothetical protein A4S14_18895 [Proteobacteria bacterium SG_bin9]